MAIAISCSRVSPDGILEIEGAESAVTELYILMPEGAVDDPQVIAFEAIVLPLDPFVRTKKRSSVIITKDPDHTVTSG